MVEPREAIFISHAAPEDNAFTIWLGAKLTAMGYAVWADVLRLKGGEDWQRKLENIGYLCPRVAGRVWGRYRARGNNE